MVNWIKSIFTSNGKQEINQDKFTIDIVGTGKNIVYYPKINNLYLHYFVTVSTYRKVEDVIPCRSLNAAELIIQKYKNQNYQKYNVEFTTKEI